MDNQDFGGKAKVLMTCFIATELLFLGALLNFTPVYGSSDFGLTISQTCPISQTCFFLEPTQIGLTAKFTISYMAFSGFMETINEAVSGVPVASFAMGTFFLSSSSTDILSIGNLSPATTYRLTVTATASDGNSHSVATTLTTPSTNNSDSNSNGMIGSANILVPDFNLAITPAIQAPSKGVTSATYFITYTSINGLTGPIDEKVTNLPPEFVTFFSSNYNYANGPSGGPVLGPTPSPSYGRCYLRYVGVYTCSDALTIYFNIANGAEVLQSTRIYSIIVTAAAEGGSPTHSVTISLTVP